MNNDEFEQMVNGAFDPLKVVLAEAVESTKTLVDAIAEIHAHAGEVGLPEEVSNEIAVRMFELYTTGSVEGE